MENRRRNSLRMRGYDYSQSGGYFVTICTAGRGCILGEVVAGKVRLSEIGKIVELCWRMIPDHYPLTRVGVFQILPNHIHGIIEIQENTRKGEVASRMREHDGVASLSWKGEGTSPLRNVRLGGIVARFKYQATKEINRIMGTPGRKVFQRSFYDHIIRDDVDRFFVESYIELNPIMWQLDVNNPQGRHMSIGQVRKILKEEHGFGDGMVEELIEYRLRAFREL